MFPDEFILERYVAEDVVFAIPAFRLGVFGQLYFGPSAVLTENLLMFDAVQAIHFVHHEIENFGGDPKSVTAMGHSSGATLVDALGFSNLIDPDMKMFQQMIALSAPGMFGFYDLVVENSFIFAERLGVDRKSLRLIEKPRNLIYGTTEHEFRTVKFRNPYISGCFMDFENPVAVSRYFDHQLMDHVDDWINGDTAGIFISAATYSAAMANAGADVYLFETRQKPYSFHVSDMQYFIGIHREVVHFKDMDILDTFYSKMLVNFTKTGVPSPNWEKLNPSRMNYLELKVDTTMEEGPIMLEKFHEKEMRFWFGEMTDIDRNITKLRKSKGLGPESHEVSSQLKTDHSKNNSPVMLKAIEISSTTEEPFHVYLFQQWWFFLVVGLILFAVAILTYILAKATNEEELPLI
uniref:COesterase domain-containing protein n=1 Tax=Caenorhabditis tropicalis TaxID=1561998 RepID=A0A1I7TZ48_9PELO